MKTFLTSIALIFFIVSNCTSLCAQSNSDIKLDRSEGNKWFASFSYGVQMSGIKSEDFVSSNYSPVYKLSFGKWITKDVALRVGYQGRYFRTIADEIRYTYDFYSIEGVLDIRNFFSKEKRDRIYMILLHAGPGLFYHKVYDRINVHGNMGISNVFTMSKRIKLVFDISTIIGWDIYQGDQDILPNTSLGILYKF
ncbi:hypothetical protein [Pseudotenacibaculum haliotis]|uniref:Outer membrane protein beta-barrel domain-containing protein n=1 Tax=Pseudotenacibaculum haliotis TaxID=1862138 RepID=A0ABW5LTH3_9FLAO